MNVHMWVNERASIQYSLQENTRPALPLRARGARKGLTTGKRLCYIMDMLDMGKTLRDAVEASGLSMRRLSILSGVNRISLMRFMAGETDLNLAAASMLADFLGLELQPKQTRKRGN